MRRPRARRGDDTDRPCPRDDFRRIVTPLYPAEDRHETAKPNSQNIPLLRSDFIHFSRNCSVAAPSSPPVHIHNCEPSPAHSCVQGHGCHLEKWRRGQCGRIALFVVYPHGSCSLRARCSATTMGRNPSEVAAHRMELIRELDRAEPGEVSARARRPVRRRRHDSWAGWRCAAGWRPLPHRRPRRPRPHAVRRPRPRPAPRAHRGR